VFLIATVWLREAIRSGQSWHPLFAIHYSPSAYAERGQGSLQWCIRRMHHGTTKVKPWGIKLVIHSPFCILVVSFCILMEENTREQRRSIVESWSTGHGAGVYVLWPGRDVIYVGQSSSIRWRLIQHLDKPFDRVQTIPVPNRFKRNILEQWLICTLRPALNSQQYDKQSIRRAILRRRIQQYRDRNQRDLFDPRPGYTIWKLGTEAKHQRALREIKALPIAL
jgi:hypothetical protein